MKRKFMVLVGFLVLVPLLQMASASALPSYVGVKNGRLYEYTGAGTDNSSGGMEEFKLKVEVMILNITEEEGYCMVGYRVGIDILEGNITALSVYTQIEAMGGYYWANLSQGVHSTNADPAWVARVGYNPITEMGMATKRLYNDKGLLRLYEEGTEGDYNPYYLIITLNTDNTALILTATIVPGAAAIVLVLLYVKVIKPRRTPSE